MAVSPLFSLLQTMSTSHMEGSVLSPYLLNERKNARHLLGSVTSVPCLPSQLHLHAQSAGKPCTKSAFLIWNVFNHLPRCASWARRGWPTIRKPWKGWGDLAFRSDGPLPPPASSGHVVLPIMGRNNNSS